MTYYVEVFRNPNKAERAGITFEDAEAAAEAAAGAFPDFIWRVIDENGTVVKVAPEGAQEGE